MTKDNLQVLKKMLAMVDTKSAVDEFVAAFKQVIAVFAEMKKQNEALQKKIESRAGSVFRDGKDGKDGKDGRDGVDGMDGKDGIGKDGTDGTDGKDGLNGQDGSPDTPDQIIEKINQSSLQIAQERIVGLADTVRNMLANTVSSVGITTTNFFKNGSLIGRAKNINFAEGTNMTVSMVQTGDQMNVTLASSGGSGGITVYTETLTDSGDHQNFTSIHTITTVFVLATLNGQYISSGNYSKSGNTITLSSPDANIASVGLEIVYA